MREGGGRGGAVVVGLWFVFLFLLRGLGVLFFWGGGGVAFGLGLFFGYCYCCCSDLLNRFCTSPKILQPTHHGHLLILGVSKINKALLHFMGLKAFARANLKLSTDF